MSEALERLFPHPATSTSQSEIVCAPPESVFRAVKSIDLGDSKPVRAAAERDYSPGGTVAATAGA